MTIYYYFCASCGAELEWRYNEAIDDFAWWCPACGGWADEIKIFEVEK